MNISFEAIKECETIGDLIKLEEEFE